MLLLLSLLILGFGEKKGDEEGGEISCIPKNRQTDIDEKIGAATGDEEDADGWDWGFKSALAGILCFDDGEEGRERRG